MSQVVVTFRYLRLAIVGLIAVLGVSVAWEHAHAPNGCWQTSISDYYYSPVRPLFVATILATAVCMIVIKGSTRAEDLSLNITAIFAVAVAVVPTPDPGGCQSVRLSAGPVSATTDNNVAALLIVGVAALLGAAISAARRARRSGLPRLDVVTLVVDGVLIGGYAGWFRLDHASFLAWGHYLSATFAFLGILAIVASNLNDLAIWNGGADGGPRLRHYLNRYAAVLTWMMCWVTAIGALWFVTPWRHAVLWLEGILITTFGIFWAVQAHELWSTGTRGTGADDRWASDVLPDWRR